MITCPKCQTVNESTAVVCAKCATDLLAQPNFGERVRKNLAWIITFFLALIGSTILNINYGTAEFAGAQICLGGVSLVALVVLLVAFFRKYPADKLYQLRALRHLALDEGQAKEDFLKAFKSTPPSKRFNELQSYFPQWNRVDPASAQLALVNLIRIVPVNERHSLGKKYPKTMINQEKVFELEAQNAGAAGDLTTAARKYIYYTYFLESKFGAMFQTKATTDLMDAAVDGWKKGVQQVKFNSSVNDIRANLISSGSAMTLTACEICRQIVGDEHEPKHRKKLYPIYLLADETISVKQAFLERYSLARR